MTTAMTGGMPLELLPPDISRYSCGSHAIPYAITLAAQQPGPHVVISALMHGNELCGAIAANRLLTAGLRPTRGQLSFIFCNIEAFGHFHPDYPAMSRYVDEDMNRLWSPERLSGPDRPGDSSELRRARAIWPLFADADLVLDIHSMLHDPVPMMLAGAAPRALALAQRIGLPGWIITDQGHADGSRLIDHPRFTGPDQQGPTALLVECGQHWQKAAADTALTIAARFLEISDIIQRDALPPWLPSTPWPPSRLVEVTQTVTVLTNQFHFTREVSGMDIIPTAGTLIALDGDLPVRTPHDHCILIMPARHPVRGHTAVRLGRLVA